MRIPKFHFHNLGRILGLLAAVGALIFLIDMRSSLNDTNDLVEVVNKNQAAGRQRTYQTQAGQCHLYRMLGQPEQAYPPNCWSANVRPLWEGLTFESIASSEQNEKTQRCIAQIVEAINNRTAIETECK